jgi:PilZ domain
MFMHLVTLADICPEAERETAGHMVSLMQASDRRYRPRFELKVPFEIRDIDQPVTTAQFAESSDISASGLYFVTEVPMSVGTRIDLFIQIPSEISGNPSPRWRCMGRIVRVHAGSLAAGNGGNGVEIQCYEVLDGARSTHTGENRFTRFLLH